MKKINDYKNYLHQIVFIYLKMGDSVKNILYKPLIISSSGENNGYAKYEYQIGRNQRLQL